MLVKVTISGFNSYTYLEWRENVSVPPENIVHAVTDIEGMFKVVIRV